MVGFRQPPDGFGHPLMKKLGACLHSGLPRPALRHFIYGFAWQGNPIQNPDALAACPDQS